MVLVNNQLNEIRVENPRNGISQYLFLPSTKIYLIYDSITNCRKISRLWSRKINIINSHKLGEYPRICKTHKNSENCRFVGIFPKT